MFKEFTVELPSFADRSYSIEEFGAVADGITSNTKAINSAVQKANKEGGGHVVIPRGLWLTGPIEILSNVDLHFEDGAVLVFDKSKEEYPLIRTDFEGIPRIRALSPIYADHAENIAITGNGVIDGSGHLWRPVKKFKMTERQWNELLKISKYVIPSNEGGIWVPTETIWEGNKAGEVDFNDPDALEKAAPYYDFYRPVMVSLKHCDKVLIDGVALQNSPAWNLHPFFCTNFTLRNARVSNPYHAQNGDGIDLESCVNAHIHHTFFETGDDGICVKSGKNAVGRKIKGATENVHIHDCTCSWGHGGFVIGSEMSRGVRNVLVENCTFISSDIGIRMKSAMGRGGTVENIEIRNINMTDIKEQAIILTMDYVLNSLASFETIEASLDPEDIPVFKDILLKGIVCRGGKMGVEIKGMDGIPNSIRNITIEDSLFITKEESFVKNASYVEFIHNRFIKEA